MVKWISLYMANIQYKKETFFVISVHSKGGHGDLASDFRTAEV